MRLEPGYQVGKWEIVRPIGEGGFGHVYEALDPESASRCALKVLRVGNETQADRLLREFEPAFRLRSPGIVESTGMWVVKEGPLSGHGVLELELAKSDLGSRLQKAKHHRLEEEEVCRIIAQVAQGLEDLHSAGFVHADIKPSNVLQCESGWKLGDFGLTGELGSRSYAFRFGATLDYLPPDELSASSDSAVRPSSDVFALAIVLHEAVAGRHPFPGSPGRGRIASLREGSYEIHELVPAQLAGVISACLNVDRHSRLTASELRQALESRLQAIAAASDLDPWRQLLGRRIVLLDSEIDDEMANVVCARILWLSQHDDVSRVSLYIDSPGGAVTAAMAIHDTIRFVKPPVSTVCLGVSGGISSLLLCAGAKGHRYVLPHSRIHFGPLVATSPSSSPEAEDNLRQVHLELQKLIREHTGLSSAKVDRLLRGRWLNASEAVELGVADRVVQLAELPGKDVLR